MPYWFPMGFKRRIISTAFLALFLIRVMFGGVLHQAVCSHDHGLVATAAHHHSHGHTHDHTHASESAEHPADACGHTHCDEEHADHSSDEELPPQHDPDCWTCHVLTHAVDQPSGPEIVSASVIQIGSVLDVAYSFSSSHRSVLGARGPPEHLLIWS